jgi:vibriolysin
LKGQSDDHDNNHINDAIWKIKEDVYTTATAGNTLRYMYDPQNAGDSYYYPNRYQGTSDNGGVHSNSGIANSGEYD